MPHFKGIMEFSRVVAKIGLSPSELCTRQRSSPVRSLRSKSPPVTIVDGNLYRSFRSPAIATLIPSIQSPMSKISRFVRSESGATTAEYGIIIVVVAGIAIFVLSQLNGALNTLYGKFAGKVNSVN